MRTEISETPKVCSKQSTRKKHPYTRAGGRDLPIPRWPSTDSRGIVQQGAPGADTANAASTSSHVQVIK